MKVAILVLFSGSMVEKKDGRLVGDQIKQRRVKMRPVKNKRRIDPRYFLDETTERDPDASPDNDEKNKGKEHDEDCDCSKCPEPKKKKKGKDKNGRERELIQGEKELSEDEGDNN